MPASQGMQPAQQGPVGEPREQQVLYLVIDKPQPGTSRQLHVTFSPTKHFNEPSVVSFTGEESAQNISGLFRILENIQIVMSYPQLDTPQPLTLIDVHQHTSCLVLPPSSKNLCSSQPSPNHRAVIQVQAAATVVLVPTFGPFCPFKGNY